MELHAFLRSGEDSDSHLGYSCLNNLSSADSNLQIAGRLDFSCAFSERSGRPAMMRALRHGGVQSLEEKHDGYL